MNVLITSASRKVALVNAFRMAVAAEGGGRVLAGDSSRLAAALYHADKGFLLCRSDEADFIDRIIDLCQLEQVRLIVPTRDEELPVFAEARERLEYAGVMVLVAPPPVIATCQDKQAFVNFCSEHGYPTPRTYKVSELGAVTKPLFVRPRRGKGGKGLHVRSQAELEYALGSISEPIVQEHVEAREFTIDLFADLAARVISVVPRERLLVFGGESYVSRTVRHEALMGLMISLSDALGLVGHNTIQCFVDADEDIKLIEVNPRYGGAANLGFSAGAPTPQYAVQLALGRHVPSRIGEFEEGRIMLRYTEDLFLPGDALVHVDEPTSA